MNEKEKALLNVALDVYLYKVAKDVFLFDTVAEKYDKFPKRYDKVISEFDHVSMDVAKYILKKEYCIKVATYKFHNHVENPSVSKQSKIETMTEGLLSQLYERLENMTKSQKKEARLDLNMSMLLMLSQMNRIDTCEKLLNILYKGNYNCIRTVTEEDRLFGTGEYRLILDDGQIIIPMMKEEKNEG